MAIWGSVYINKMEALSWVCAIRTQILTYVNFLSICLVTSNFLLWMLWYEKVKSTPGLVYDYNGELMIHYISSA